MPHASDYVLGYVVDVGIEAGGLDIVATDPVAVPQIDRRVPVAAAAQRRLVGMRRLPGRQKPVGIRVGGATNIVRGRMLRRALAREHVRNDDYEDQKADKQEYVAVPHCDDTYVGALKMPPARGALASGALAFGADLGPRGLVQDPLLADSHIADYGDPPLRLRPLRRGSRGPHAAAHHLRPGTMPNGLAAPPRWPPSQLANNGG